MSQTTTAPSNGDPKPTPWVPPTGDEEFEFTDIDSAPAWVDRGWASYDRGPALALPAGDVWGKPPYTTVTARAGDTVIYKAATASRPGKFEVVAGEPPADQSTPRPPQVSAASLEDLLKGGWLAPDDLSETDKAQVLSSSPELKPLIEDGAGAPAEQVNVADYVKTS